MEPEKDEKPEPKVSRSKDILGIRMEIWEVKNTKTIEKKLTELRDFFLKDQQNWQILSYTK